MFVGFGFNKHPENPFLRICIAVYKVEKQYVLCMTEEIGEPDFTSSLGQTVPTEAFLYSACRGIESDMDVQAIFKDCLPEYKMKWTQ